MTYMCPRCGKAAERKSGNAWYFGGGIVGALLASAFAGMTCATCGDLSRSEFPPEVRKKLMFGTVSMIVGAIVLLIAVITVLIWLRSTDYI